MPDNPQNILVIHVAGLGQTVMALPALRALRQHLPTARITVATSTSAAGVICLAHCADEVLPVGRLRGGEVLAPRSAYRSSKTLGEIKRGYYDLAIELQRNTEAGVLLQLAQARERLDRRRNTLSHGLSVVIERATQQLIKAPKLTHDAHAYLRKLEPLGVRPVEAEPRLTTDREADARLERLLTKHGVQSGELLIGIHPGAGRKKPRWEFGHFVNLAARLHHNFNARLLIFSGKGAGLGERGLARRLVSELPGKSAIAFEAPKLPDLVSALARLSLFVGNHSGPAHLAAAAGAPVVVISPHPEATAQDVLGQRQIHVRAPHISMITEEAVYHAACQLLQSNRASVLSAR
ncbi:MAG: glycosyltransferase family 9 protein [Acidobacteria bacterium]|nr:glycosyltransferase family 9 protein [Acidobacteriota bacterium]MBI3426838.1 glycosyltransferase family 9 protein [Acidobacteriota bacterium]